MGLKENTHKNTKVKNASPKALYVDIGKRLRMLRFELDYTQEQMAETLGLSLAYYGKVERGVYGLSLEKLVIVHSKFDVDINYLLTGNKRNESWTSLVIILLINIVTFKLYLILSKEKELQKYNTVYAQQLELCNQHMREKETVMMEFRNARHDMKQHFIVLIELLTKEDNQKAIEYLRKLINIEPLSKLGISRTDNIVVDSLVNSKYAVAIREQIKFEVDIHIPMQLPFKSADLCILLGNILDNAIEASVMLDQERRYIKFFMKYEKNTLIITVINAYNGELLRNGSGKIITNKGDSENHGIGLESVRKVTKKYHGSVVIEPGTQKFTIKIVLCDLPEKLQITS